MWSNSNLTEGYVFYISFERSHSRRCKSHDCTLWCWLLLVSGVLRNTHVSSRLTEEQQKWHHHLSKTNKFPTQIFSCQTRYQHVMTYNKKTAKRTRRKDDTSVSVTLETFPNIISLPFLGTYLASHDIPSWRETTTTMTKWENILEQKREPRSHEGNEIERSREEIVLKMQEVGWWAAYRTESH